MTKYFSLILFFALGLYGTYAFAEEEQSTQLFPVKVFGAQEELNIPVRPQKISKEKIKSDQLTDVGRALKQTSGVYIREEDGQGLRPNIGLRGTNPDRSKKIVLMENGILIGPAPYSAPAAYYTPSLNNTESLEVYKGFKSTIFGPNSVGGAIDYRSITIPDRQTTELFVSGGAFSTWNNHIRTGGPTSFGGYHLNLSNWSSDGFKELDSGAKTGFVKNEVQGRIRKDLNEAKTHFLELRLGYGEEDSKETYLGLSREDFNLKPYRRYNSSEKDFMKWQHVKAQLQHGIFIGESTFIDTSLYHHSFKRRWFRLDRFRGTIATPRLRDLLNDPTSNTDFYRILRGEQDSASLGTNADLVIMDNDREMLSQGLQTRASSSFQVNDIKLSPVLFARVHRDQIERNHNSEIFQMTGGSMVSDGSGPQAETKNKDSAQALTLATAVDIAIDQYTITPVLRLESAQFEFQNDLDSSKNNSRNDDALIKGLSLQRQWGQHFVSRISRNEAVTLAGLNSQGTEAKEEALIDEIEFRYANPEQQFEMELTLFQTDYKNLTDTCTFSSGCSNAQIDSTINGGKAKIEGLEFALGKGTQFKNVLIPIQAQVTLLNARFMSNFESQSDEWGRGDIFTGDPLPYIPRSQYSLSIGSQWKNWKQDLTLTHQSKVFDKSLSSERGEIAAFGIVDYSTQFQLNRSTRILGKFDNILGREYAVAARPFGLRPGKPRSFQVAVQYEF